MTGHFEWPANLRPAAIIDRYIESGIPVIIGLRPWAAGQEEWHAVVAFGHCRQVLDLSAALSATNPTRADYVRHFLVNDDQRGVSLRLPVSSGDALKETPYSAEDIGYLIVPLPSKVYTPAESAEKLGWDFLRRYEAEWPTMVPHCPPSSIKMGEELIARLQSNEVVARTYLTYGWRYKQRLMRNSCAPALKEAVYNHDFSRFVWVTEFGTRASFNHLDDAKHEIFAHSVVDATSNHFWEGRSVIHAPGFVWRWFHDPSNPFGSYVDAITPVPDDRPYGVKIRGSYPTRAL